MGKKIRVMFSMDVEDLALLHQVLLSGHVGIEAELGEDSKFAKQVFRVADAAMSALGHAASAAKLGERYNEARASTQDALDHARASGVKP